MTRHPNPVQNHRSSPRVGVWKTPGTSDGAGGDTQLRLRYPLARGRWVPYCTAGMGIAYGEINAAGDSGPPYRVSAKGIHPALGVGVGVERFVASNVSFSADVRRIYTWDHAIKVADGPSRWGDFSAVLFTIGFRACLFNL